MAGATRPVSAGEAMTNLELVRALRKHVGRVYACVNAGGCQYHIEVNKAALVRQFADAAVDSPDFETDVEVTVVSGDMYFDTVVE